jgi:hypothetical protein
MEISYHPDHRQGIDDKDFGLALDSIGDEIRYRLELCPCTTVNDDYVELNVVSAL